MNHSKIKNTGIIFELLVRKIASDIMNGEEVSPSLKIIKEYFKKGTLLNREYNLYKILMTTKVSSIDKSNYLINEVLNSRKKINNAKLKKEKYEVIKLIKENYNKIEEFFNSKLDNYKELATIYKIFEYDEKVDNPEEYIDNRFNLVEYINRGNNKDNIVEVKKVDVLEEFNKYNKDIRLLTYKILVDKFNDKYSKELNEGQRKLLKEYIYNISNTNKLKEYIFEQISGIKNILLKYYKRIDDKVIKIKLNEVIHKLDSYNNIKSIKEENVLELLRYYELTSELTNGKY